MKVGYLNKLDQPLIKISNNKLKECGFNVGDEFEITYEKDKIIIVKFEEESSKLIQKWEGMVTEKKKCVLCKKIFRGYGNNSQPLKDGLCCDDCNLNKVIPERLKGGVENEIKK
jgi:hypothetical protein